MINYKEFYEQAMRDNVIVRQKLTEASETISINNEFFGDQLMSLNTDIARLKQKLRMKEVN